MKVSDLSKTDLIERLRRGGLKLNLRPFVAQLQSDISSLAHDLALVYPEFEVCAADTFADFHVELARERGLRRWIRPLARFHFDGRRSFTPLPARQVFAMLEWGLNWCVAAHSHQYLIVHAAVLEKGGHGAVLPAPPGSGKSTLCAALILRGWRLLSDELALCDMDTGLIYGMARPVNLKNRSIDIISAFAPEAVMSAPVPDTTKGTVACLRPPAESVRRAHEPVRPTWIISPQYRRDADPSLEPYSRARMFMLIAEQSFNYDIHGRRGFEAVARLVDQSSCLQFTYGRLDDAVQVFDKLAAERTGCAPSDL